MANLEYKEKMLGVIGNKEEKKIIITHITIRQSITFLVLRILTIELLASIAIIVFHTILLRTEIRNIIGENLIVFNIPLFVFLVVIKTALLIFVIIQWLNEYYEITTNEIIYRKGLIFKREERHLFEHIGSVKLEQGLFGRIFNFGTIRLFNWTRERFVYMYLIHSPQKYMHILDRLLPSADKEKKVFREHLINPEDDRV